MALGRWNGAAIDEFGNTMDGCSVEVRRESDNVLVSVYSDRAGTVSLGNPFTAADGGNIGFHVAGGAYKITATLGAVSRVWRYVAVGLNAESDVTAGDVVGPASAVDDRIATYDGITGKLIQDGGETIASLKAYSDSLVVGLIDDRGNYNASVNTFPASGGSGAAGAILKGDLWFISVAGTLGGVAAAIGDQVRALVDTPGQTAANWAVTEGNVGFVPAPIASPTFTGVPEGPTAAPGTNTTQLSTTAFVKAAIDVVLGGVAAGFDTLAEIVAGFIPNSLLTTRGDIIIRNATVPARLAAGTTGQYLKTLGSAANPIYDNPVARFGDYVAGRWYQGSHGVNLNAGGTLACVADTLYVLLLTVKMNQAFDRLGVRCEAAGTATAMRLGLYNFVGGVPTSLIEEANTVGAPTSLGIKTGIVTQTLTPGFYALVINLNGTATFRAGTGAASGLQELIGVSDDGTDFLPTVLITGTHAYAALPANFPAVTRTNANIPVGALRAV